MTDFTDKFSELLKANVNLQTLLQAVENARTKIHDLENALAIHIAKVKDLEEGESAEIYTIHEGQIYEISVEVTEQELSEDSGEVLQQAEPSIVRIKKLDNFN